MARIQIPIDEGGYRDWKGPPADSNEVVRWSEVDDRSLSRDDTSS